MMSDLVRFKTTQGSVLIEVDENSFGVERVARDRNGVIDAGRRLDDALQAARPTIRAVIETVREMVPDEFEVEFGIKLNAEAGVVVAKTAAEGHFTVRLAWQRSSEGPAGA
ncbi:CU044_2847 family protein [Streptomyces sp. NPDC002402]